MINAGMNSIAWPLLCGDEAIISITLQDAVKALFSIPG